MAYIYDLTDTWNAGGTTFYGIKMNVTNTASASGSKLLSLQVGGSEQFGVDKNGNVGIGTSSPNTKLQVAGVIRAEAVGGEGGQLELLNTANSAVQVLLDVGPSDVGRLWTIPAGPLTFGTNTAERMRIDSSGNVGIGTSSPNAAARLEVASTTSGFLPPRMTTAQRDAISTPPNGLMLYNTSTDKLQVRAAGSWVDLH